MDPKRDDGVPSGDAAVRGSDGGCGGYLVGDEVMPNHVDDDLPPESLGEEVSFGDEVASGLWFLWCALCGILGIPLSIIVALAWLTSKPSVPPIKDYSVLPKEYQQACISYLIDVQESMSRNRR